MSANTSLNFGMMKFIAPIPISRLVGMRIRRLDENSLKEFCARDTPSSRCARLSLASSWEPRSLRASSIAPKTSPGSRE